MRTRIVAALAFAAAAAAWAAGRAQTIGPQTPPLIITSLVGRDSFEFYCASCHGRSGAGDGTVAATLKTPPPDLRRLARRNGGVFPRDRVLDFVTTGGAVPAHGSSDMPVWGPIFRGLDRSDSLVSVRIKNLVAYLESIQTK